MNYHIAVIKGDGIGPEIVTEAMKVLEEIGKKYGHTFEFEEVLMGGIAIDQTGCPLPEETIKACKKADSILFGAIGGPKWDKGPKEMRPETGLLALRKEMGFYANIRPAKLYPALADACPLKEEVSGGAFDFVIVRELTGGIYFGEKGRRGDCAYDTEQYSAEEIKRIGRIAFKMAQKRGKKLLSIDKANVMESSRFWREIMHDMKEEYPDVAYADMLVDNAAMQLVRDPKQFDVIVTSNIFGDILSDEAGMITGSIGMLPSSSMGDGKQGLYEPIHGSAPDIAGQGLANPIATILSAAMMLRYSFDLAEEALLIEKAVDQVLKAGYRTKDIYREGSEDILVSTVEMGKKIRECLQ